MKNSQVYSENNNGIKVMNGILVSFFITLISLFVCSIVLVYTNISESLVPVIIIVITFISILTGTIISMRKEVKKGMLNGAIIGGMYVIVLYLSSSILNTGFSMNIYTILMIIGGMISGIIGGIIAVNT